MFRSVVIAPHPDDEVIGCFTLLYQRLVTDIIIVSETSSDQVEKLKKLYSEYFKTDINIVGLSSKYMSASTYSMFKNLIINNLDRLTRDVSERDLVLLLVPEPEKPDHKFVHDVVLSYLYERDAKQQQILPVFYSVEMTQSYCYKLSNKMSSRKLELLNTAYPEKSDLWNRDRKYILYEGYRVSGRLVRLFKIVKSFLK